MDQRDDACRLTAWPGGAIGQALLASLGLHILILWLAAHYLFASKPSPSPSKQLTIRLAIQPTYGSTAEEQHATRASSAGKRNEASSGGAGAEKPQVGPASRLTADSPSAAVTGKSNNGHNKQVNAARLLATAKQMAREMAAKERTEAAEQADSPLAKAIGQAFKSSHEPPGVSRLADGRIRVVTQFGTVYCVKPKDDSGLLGPEEDLPVIMSCN